MLGKCTSHNIQIKSYTAFPVAEQPLAQMEVLCRDQRQRVDLRIAFFCFTFILFLIGQTSNPSSSLFLLPSSPLFYLSHLFHNGTFLNHSKSLWQRWCHTDTRSGVRYGMNKYLSTTTFNFQWSGIQRQRSSYADVLTEDLILNGLHLKGQEQHIVQA